MADSPPLRVAILARSVHPLHGVGGLERHVYDLLHHLARRGLSITLITQPPTTAGGLGAQGDVSPLFDAASGHIALRTVPYVTFPGAGRRGTTVIDRATAYPIFGWRAGRVAVQLVRAGQVDLVHALGASGLGYAWAYRRQRLSAPFVFNPQGLEEFGGTHPGFARLKRLAYTPLQVAVRACAHAADAVLATDHALVAPVRAHLAIDPARIHVVPNAVDLEMIDRARVAAAGPARALRERLGLATGERLLLSVGRLEENKGFHVLAAALAQLGARPGHGASWRWALVGDGPFRSTIASAIETAGLASRVHLAGRVSEGELAAWYAAADVFVHPTLYEGSSLVTLEAMAGGKPVVATRAGGLPDKVRPGHTGWLVEPGSPAALADAIAEALARDDEALARFGAAGRSLVEKAFAWPVVAAQLESLYDALRSRQSSPHAAGVMSSTRS
ncbi:MAG: glycosyltransferase family 4 protein [Vicinamibacteraceae bacterium]